MKGWVEWYHRTMNYKVITTSLKINSIGKDGILCNYSVVCIAKEANLVDKAELKIG